MLSNSLTLSQMLNANPFTSSHLGHQQIRLAHTDVKIPDLTAYRKKSTRDPTKTNDKSIDERRGFTYMATATVGVGTAVFGKAMIRDLCSIMAPAKEVLALSKIEIDLNDVPLGKNVTFKWRGKPLFVKHRTEEEIQREAAVDLASLRDPQADSDRTKRPEWLVLLGVCTHLGCVPIANSGNLIFDFDFLFDFKLQSNNADSTFSLRRFSWLFLSLSWLALRWLR